MPLSLRGLIILRAVSKRYSIAVTVSGSQLLVRTEHPAFCFSGMSFVKKIFSSKKKDQGIAVILIESAAARLY